MQVAADAGPYKDTERIPVIRPARAEDAEGIAALFRTIYGKTTHPCQESETVWNGIASGNELWHVAEIGSELRGCMCVVRHDWNCSSELGRAIILPRHRTLGLCSRLTRACLGQLYSDRSTLSFCVVRSYKTHCLANRIADLPWVPVGHDGGKNIANGVREYHMYAIAKPAAVQFRHVAPIQGAACSASVQHGIYAPVGLRPTKGTYPEICFTGSSAGESDGSSRFAFDRGANAIEVLGYHGRGKAQVEVARDLRTFLVRYRHACHISAQVLPDKDELIRAMLETGFDISGYLPAWHCNRGTRYDCLMLVKRQFAGEPATNGFDREIRNLSSSLTALAGKFLRSGVIATMRPAAEADDRT